MDEQKSLRWRLGAKMKAVQPVRQGFASDISMSVLVALK